MPDLPESCLYLFPDTMLKQKIQQITAETDYRQQPEWHAQEYDILKQQHTADTDTQSKQP